MHRGQQVTDEAKRISDAYNLHRIAAPYDSIGKWIAVRLSDGTGDGVLYDSKRDAVSHQHHNEDFYAFIQLGPWPFTPQDAQAFLNVQRRMYDANLRFADPDAVSGGRDLIKRSRSEDQYNQIAAMFGNGRPSNISFGR